MKKIRFWMGPTGPRLGIGEVYEFVHDKRGRVEIYFEPRDAWVGVFVSPPVGRQRGAVFVCLVPFLVLRFSRGRRA